MLSRIRNTFVCCHRASLAHSAITGINKTLSGIIAVSRYDTAEIRLMKLINPKHGSEATGRKQAEGKMGSAARKVCKGPSSGILRGNGRSKVERCRKWFNADTFLLASQLLTKMQESCQEERGQRF